MTAKEGGPSHLKTATEIVAERSRNITEPLATATFPTTTAVISKKELEELRAQAAKAQENWERLLRTQADLENHKKRVASERQELIKTANEKLFFELLTPLDHFEIGLQSVQSDPYKTTDDPLRKGMEMVLAQFQQFLKSHGVTEIQAVGQMFDPALHEAVAHQPSDTPEGQVIQQTRKGYRLNHKLLRPAAVVVSKGKFVEE